MRPAPALLIVLGVLLTAALGVWQYQRAQLRLGRQAQIEHATRAPVIALDARARALSDVANRRVRVTGRFLRNRVVYLDNRPRNELPGFYVVMALQVSPERVVLVNRGWLPRDLRDRTAIMPYPTPAGDVTIEGIAQADASRAFELGHGGSAAGMSIRQNLDVAAYARETSLPLQPFVIMQTNDTGDHLLRDWPAPASGADRNYGYMAQWFGMSLILALLGLRLAYRRGRRLAQTGDNLTRA
ncbi:SURF1 family protein [Pandoraea nosoerga]|nr:SURF1 family protein [Pandoraea nosoerga]MBN4664583.1 SURF1 family protein [Pandoraea nosoerga]MBN4674381.1 SURF1 family protein [Pandoraea nosoerga]MBN4679649.1 SURF1 family protein [Pandoraea nosoerga]MBN4743262.1 SURF1 family protein [Pandoraea nosoerga]